MNKQIYADFERCSYCLGCEIACQRENQGLSLIRVVRVEDRFAVPLNCRHCNPAPCAIACPTRALSFDGDVVELEPSKCTGCTLCLYACPFGVMDFDAQTKTAANCDMCAARRAQGRDPACFITCPSSALHYGDYADYTSKERQRASAAVLRAQLLKGGIR